MDVAGIEIESVAEGEVESVWITLPRRMEVLREVLGAATKPNSETVIIGIPYRSHSASARSHSQKWLC